SIPHGLSLIVNHSMVGKVRGLKDFVPADQPPAIPLIFYTFRVMIAAGFAMTGLALVSAIMWWNRRKTADDSILPVWLLKCWVAAIPLGYIATECGWVVREVGRQPWAVYGLLRTEHAVSNLPAAAVATSLALFIAIYTLLLVLFLLFARRIIMDGPDMRPLLPNFIPISNTNMLLQDKD
ncbi:MAG: cytochrome ubiquinol oxidase subunit I, partial [Methylococcaceae bacterium]